MIFARQYQATVYDQRATSAQAAGLTVETELTEDVVKQVITPAVSSGKMTFPATSVITSQLELPGGGFTPTAATRYLVQIRVEDGICRVTETSTEFTGTSTVMVYSTTTQAGMYCAVMKPSILSVCNPGQQAIKVEWTIAVMPDITVETSFRGMQSTGLEATIP